MMTHENKFARMKSGIWFYGKVQLWWRLQFLFLLLKKQLTPKSTHDKNPL